MFEVETPVGAGAFALDTPDSPRAVLVLGHGAGGGIDAPDLRAVRDAAVAAGYAVARTVQPYRHAGKRAPAPAPTLDTAFGALVAAVRARVGDIPVVLGGRSSGARVACRTAAALDAAAVLALSFPLHPPGRPERSRAAELTAVTVPVLVVQGERDTFGRPAEFAPLKLGPNVRLHPVPAAGHGLAPPKSAARNTALLPVTAQIVSWLAETITG